MVAAGTGREIWEQTRGRLDAVVLAAGQSAQSVHRPGLSPAGLPSLCARIPAVVLLQTSPPASAVA
jgi:hypothetical protein